jgi:hypothetical protein
MSIGETTRATLSYQESKIINRGNEPDREGQRAECAVGAYLPLNAGAARVAANLKSTLASAVALSPAECLLFVSVVKLEKIRVQTLAHPGSFPLLPMIKKSREVAAARAIES